MIIINKIIVLSARKRYSIIFLRGHFVCYPHCQGDFNTSQLCWQLRMACFIRNAISFMPFVTALVLKVTTCMNGTQQFLVHQSPSTKEEYFSWIFIFQQIILLNHPRYEWKYYLNISIYEVGSSKFIACRSFLFFQERKSSYFNIGI